MDDLLRFLGKIRFTNENDVNTESINDKLKLKCQYKRIKHNATIIVEIMNTDGQHYSDIYQYNKPSCKWVKNNTEKAMIIQS